MQQPPLTGRKSNKPIVAANPGRLGYWPQCVKQNATWLCSHTASKAAALPGRIRLPARTASHCSCMRGTGPEVWCCWCVGERLTWCRHWPSLHATCLGFAKGSRTRAGPRGSRCGGQLVLPHPHTGVLLTAQDGHRGGLGHQPPICSLLIPTAAGGCGHWPDQVHQLNACLSKSAQQGRLTLLGRRVACRIRPLPGHADATTQEGKLSLHTQDIGMSQQLMQCSCDTPVALKLGWHRWRP